MSDPWLNFQYTVEFSSSNGFGKKNEGLCSVISINVNAVKHGTASYIVNPVRGDPVKRYVYGGSYTEPISISILLGEGARPWLKWFSNIQSGKSAEKRNVTLSLYGYGKSQDDPGTGQLWLRWDLVNCVPVSWQIAPMAIDDSPSAMKVDMTLQFESMVVMDGDLEMHEVMG